MPVKPTPPPPPPPPAPAKGKGVPAPAQPKVPQPPAVPAARPAGAFKLELMVFNGKPFKDHWGFWIPSAANRDIGVMLHARGDVKNGFVFEVKRSLNLKMTTNRPTSLIPLQWISGKYIDEQAMFNKGIYKLDHAPVCLFEASAHKAKPPTKSLNAIDDVTSTPGKVVKQRNCQTWIVEAADHLVHDGILSAEVAKYLYAIKQ